MSTATNVPHVILVRHAPVAEHYRKVCYGRSDVELSEAGTELSHTIVDQLAQWTTATIVHSGLRRSQYLAERLAARIGAVATCCPELRERDFGTWELQSWDAIFAEHGDAMNRILSEPDTYRPGGGETTFEHRDRVLRWYESLPHDRLTIAVTHGGTIASLLGAQRGLPVAEWLSLIPHCGQMVHLYKEQPARA
jgi:broad specificity phosphatase PhoE